MTTYDLRKKTDASTGQKVIPFSNDIRVDKLENRINNQEEKLDQNEELAELRADTSLEKQEIANDARFAIEGMKPNR